jgi:uncharacterized membrane-anchored protein YitT (DUF2179 family)
MKRPESTRSRQPVARDSPRRWFGKTRAELLALARRIVLVIIGTTIAALGYTLFQVPFNIVAGGINGTVLLITRYIDFPIGILYFLLNLPILLIGFFALERWRFLTITLLSVLVYSVAADLTIVYLPQIMAEYPITDDVLLSAIYAGIVTGIGNGLVLRGGGTLGGTNAIGRIIQLRTGFPLSQSYLFADGAIILLAGLVFGWESALIAMLTLFLGGIASDFVMEGPSVVRTVTIITAEPEIVGRALSNKFKHGVSYWEVTGAHSGTSRGMIAITVHRFQMDDVRKVVVMLDPEAFLVIGQAHQALGGAFTPLRSDR